MCRGALVAEWLRRLTRNQIPSGSVGSSPTECEITLFSFIYSFLPSADYKVVAEGLGTTFCPPSPPQTLVRNNTWSTTFDSHPIQDNFGNFGNFLKLFDNFLKTFCQLFDNFLTAFWQLFDCFLTAFWQLFDNFLTTFWQLLDHLLFLLFDTMWHYNTFVTPQVFIGPSKWRPKAR
jgi:hypothetical protein